MSKHRVFISYHHENDQHYKDELVALAKKHNLFIDYSVGLDEIDEDLSDQEIREEIRDGYLKDSSVTILLVGQETKNRKHIDWEIYSSMHDGKVNRKSGIVVVNLPTITGSCRAAHNDEKNAVFSSISNWVSYSEREEYEKAHPFAPARIIDNFLYSGCKISVIDWSDIINSPQKLKYLIDNAYDYRESCKYDLSRPMRRRNS